MYFLTMHSLYFMHRSILHKFVFSKNASLSFISSNLSDILSYCVTTGFVRITRLLCKYLQKKHKIRPVMICFRAVCGLCRQEHLTRVVAMTVTYVSFIFPWLFINDILHLRTERLRIALEMELYWRTTLQSYSDKTNNCT